jgi:hypothetical protein
MILTAQYTIDDLLTAICKEYGPESLTVILDALKRQDDFCEPGAYTDAIHEWVKDNPKELGA